MTRCFFLFLLIAAVASCRNEVADTMQSGQIVGLIGLQGRWAGPVTPKAEGCGKTATGLMTIGRTTFAFDPFQGTTVINGTVSDIGGLEGNLARPGGGQKIVSISFSGIAAQHAGGPETIDGELVSGRCSWSVSLKRG